MKIMISLLSILVIFIGAIPFIPNFPIPKQGPSYSIILIAAGIFLILIAIINQLLVGLEKFMLFIMGAALIFLAGLALLPNLFPVLPHQGFLYSGMIILVGVIGLVYGIIGMG